MRIILSHPTGNQFVRAAALGLHQDGLLARFQTSIASFPKDFIDMVGAIPPFTDIRRRRYDSQLKPVTSTWPWYEMGRIVATKAGINSLIQHETGFFSVDTVYRTFDKHVASELKRGGRTNVQAVYAYEDGAFFSFQESERLGIKRLYDLPIGYWRAARRLLENEKLTRPEWASTLTGFQDSPAKLARKDEELRMADRIFVASQFTANTLNDFPGTLAPIEVIPYGFPKVTNNLKNSSVSHRRPLKLLFVGGLSQRKGIANLFEAVDGLERHVELTLIGRKSVNNCQPLNLALAKHRWIPSLPHAEILKLMHTHDVLVFPSLFEGFGLVITEAMSQGTPVITTDRTAGPDFIEHGSNGWLVEAGSTAALKASIESLICKPELINGVGKAAMETARQRPWEVYGQELAEAIMQHEV